MKVEIDNEIDEYTPTSILVLRFLGRNHRAGHDGRWSQDLFQNGIHKHLVGSPYLNTSLNAPGNAFFQFYRNPNPWPLYPERGGQYHWNIHFKSINYSEKEILSLTLLLKDEN